MNARDPHAAYVHGSMWDVQSLAEAVLAAPTDRGTINVWLARDLARAALQGVADLQLAQGPQG